MGLYEEITKARQILDIPEQASISTVTQKYKDLLKKWHPDRCGEDKRLCEEKTRDILYAGKLLINYCNQYPVSFSRDDVDRLISPEEFWNKKFGNDPLWGEPDARS